MGAEYANNLFRIHSWIECLLSRRTKQVSQKAEATEISAIRITGDKLTPKFIDKPITVIKPTSEKKNNEKARVETARSNLFVAVL
jgi:hypothetical protein